MDSLCLLGELYPQETIQAALGVLTLYGPSERLFLEIHQLHVDTFWLRRRLVAKIFEVLHEAGEGLGPFINTFRLGANIFHKNSVVFVA